MIPEQWGTLCKTSPFFVSCKNMQKLELYPIYAAISEKKSKKKEWLKEIKSLVI